MTKDDVKSSSEDTKMVSVTLMTVNQMIEAAFGDEERNFVNFKLIQVILTVLAKQLRVLDRKIAVELDPSIVSSSTTMVVSELKIKTSAHKTKLPTPHSAQKHTSGRKRQPTEDKPSPLNDKTSASAHTKADTQHFKTSSSKKSVSKNASFEIFGNTSKFTRSSSQDKRLLQKSEHTILTKAVDGGIEDLASKASKSAFSDMEKTAFLELLEKIEEQREQILRIIHQRPNSQEEGVLSPTPIASLESTEYNYDKLLLVEKMWEKNADGRDQKRLLSVVTQDQFKELADLVLLLQKRFDNNQYQPLSLPENVELMKELRKGASLSDTMSALQLSVRLEAAEKGLEKLSSMVTELAQQLDHKEVRPHLKSDTSQTEIKDNRQESPRPGSPKKQLPQETPKQEEHRTSETSFESLHEQREARPKSHLNVKEELAFITKKKNKAALSKEQSEILETVMKLLRNADKRITEAQNKSSYLERRVNISANAAEKILKLENALARYGERINTIDTVLTSQLANYQDQLTQMQFDLESSLENMAETMANQGYDPELLLEMNSNFSHVQNEMEKAGIIQMEAIRAQKKFSASLENIKRDIEIIMEIKSDRDEVSDALRDKAGLKELNGLLTIEYYTATLGDFDKRLELINKRAENQELVWQKVIDELTRQLDYKVDLNDVQGLREDISNNLNILKQEVKKLRTIIGEPLAAGVTRRIYRDTTCITCSNPAHLTQMEDNLPRLPSVKSPVGALIPEVKEDGDHPVCIPGERVPQPIDPSVVMCNRYCGAAPKIPKRRKMAPRELTHRALIPDTDFEDDTIQEKNDEVKKPCVQCNQPRKPSVVQPSESNSFNMTFTSSVYGDANTYQS